MTTITRYGVLAVLLAFVAFGCTQTDDPLEGQDHQALGPSFLVIPNTETLDDIDIPLAEGTGVAIAGVGLVGDVSVAQPGTINIDVPGDVQQVLLYWTGHHATEGTDGEVTVNGTAVPGTLIGGPTLFFSGAWSSAQRADITDMGVVSQGPNSVEIGGMDFTTICPEQCQNLGAGLLVIYDDGSDVAEIAVKDGNDNAFINFAPPLDTTVPQTFGFSPDGATRTASLHMFAGSVAQFPSNGGRPNVVEITFSSGAVTRLVDPFQGTAGDDFDAVSFDVEIPADVTSMTIQALSEKDPSSELTGQPASFNWLAAAAVIPPGTPPVEPLGCRVTGGEVDESGNCNFCPDGSSGLNRFTCGGQAGANTALPPQPSGNWTHSNKNGPAGKFTFHGGTPSAPEGTEIAWIVCNDAGFCNPARHAPAKQIDFGGVGTFKNMQPNVPPEIADHVEVGVSLHYFEVNIDDLGEPGKGGKQDPPTDQCPANGFGKYGSVELADCDCPDFYRITIYAGPTDASQIIYEASGYLGGGNFQIHPLTGFDGN